MRLKQAMNQAGDTIVEVMISVALVGMVIGVSYQIASRALATGRDAQEQTEALKQAESQIEKLKYLATLGLSAQPNWIFDTTAGDFCVNDALTMVKSTAPTYTVDCNGKGSGNLYNVKVNYAAAPLSGGTDLFTVTVSWTRISSQAGGTVQLLYRLHNAPAPA